MRRKNRQLARSITPEQEIARLEAQIAQWRLQFEMLNDSKLALLISEARQAVNTLRTRPGTNVKSPYAKP